ncbi:hypothetical protein GC194_11270 [bacterium]|nr:hypothetical protein [bacterium]
MSDHSYYIPMLKHLLNSELYPNDYLVTQISSYPSALWPLMIGIIKFTGIEIPIIFFILYVFSIYATFLATYLLAMSLFGNQQVAFLSIFFLLFTQLGFASVGLVENGLVFRMLSLPLVIFAFYAFFEKRLVLAYILTAVSLLMHPLTGIFSISMIGLASLLLYKFIRIKQLILAVVLFGLISGPIFIIKFTSTGSGMPLIATHGWLDIMHLRSAHHVFPSTWNRMDFINSAFTILVLIISLKYRPQELFQYRAIQYFIVAILFMVAIGVIFSEIIPITIMIQLQFLRSMVMIYYFIPLFFANYYIQEMRQSTSITDVLPLIILAIFVFNIFSVTGSTILIMLSFMSLMVITILWRLYALSSKSQIWLSSHQWISNNILPIILILSIIFIGIYGCVRKGTFTIYNRDDAEWIDIQIWARENTSPKALFIVPPYLYNFRIESERSVLTTWKDGTVAFFNESFGLEWLDRLALLGYKPAQSGDTLDYVNFDQAKNILEPIYRNLNKEKILNIAQNIKICEVYFVTFNDVSKLTLTLQYRNQNYSIYIVPTEGTECKDIP